MENSSLKDQQIENQKETIASLTKTIEILEKELQQCTDPDSGEIRPSWKPGQKHGEAALLDQVRTLQKQLDDCLEQEPRRLIRDTHLDQRINIAITAALLPIKLDTKDDEGEREYHQCWWEFRQFLFDADLFNGHWTRPEFREGVDLLNNLVQATHDSWPTTIEQFEENDPAANFYGYREDYNQRHIQGVQALISAMHLVIENQDHEDIKSVVGEKDLRDMLAALKIIAFCQRLWIDAKPEEKKEQELELHQN